MTASGVSRIRFHDMRHTCATLLFQANVPAKVIQERLGHKRIQITPLRRPDTHGSRIEGRGDRVIHHRRGFEED